MPSKIVNARYYAETYSESDIKELCRIGEITPPDLDKFRNTLEEIAALYRWESAKFENLPRSNDIARELKNISKQANRLISSLEGISWDAQRKIEKQADGDGYKKITGESSDTDDPSLAISLSHLDKGVPCVIVDVPTFRSLLRGLVNASETEITDLPRGRPGRNRSWGLRLWMLNIEILWQEISDKPFTRDVTSSNEPITNAARFCVAAHQMINPKCSTSLIMTEMKDCIKETRQRAGRIRAQSDT